jgi:Domain of Unknown Function (DUF1080)
MRRRLWVAVVIVPILAVAAVVLWMASDHDDGPHNVLTPEEVSDSWTLLFDGTTTDGWEIDGQVTVRDGLLVLGGEQVGKATAVKSFDAFELRFDYRFEAGQEGVLEAMWGGSGSGYGLGYSTPKPNSWNRATYRRQAGKSSLECKPLAKPLFQLVSMGPVQGTGDSGPIKITFRVAFAGSRLALRDIKLKPLEKAE